LALLLIRYGDCFPFVNHCVDIVYVIINVKFRWSDFQLSVARNLRLLCFTLQRFVTDDGKLTPFSQAIWCKSKGNSVFVAMRLVRCCLFLCCYFFRRLLWLVSLRSWSNRFNISGQDRFTLLNLLCWGRCLLRSCAYVLCISSLKNAWLPTFFF